MTHITITDPFAGKPSFNLNVEGIAEGASIPRWAYSPEMGGTGASPQLRWDGAPAETASYAVTVFDHNAPTGSGLWHWAVIDIPATVTELPRGAGQAEKTLAEGGRVLNNDLRLQTYVAPAPPAGTGEHLYTVTVHALAVETLGDIPEDATPALLGFNLFFHSIGRASATFRAAFPEEH